MKNEKEDVKDVLVSLGTGEYYELHEGDSISIKTQKQKNAIQKSLATNKEMNQWNKELGGFVFFLFKYCNEIADGTQGILDEDITKLFYLATYVDYEGYLMLDNKPMDTNDMRLILKLGKTGFYAFYNRMIDLGVFIKDKNNLIQIDRTYFVKGELDKDIKKYYDYTRVYIKTIRYLYENVPLDNQRQLGNYFKMVPYMHRQQNVLCKNPDSTNEPLNYVTLRDLKDILGYTKNNIKPFVHDLLSTKLDNGESIIGLFITDVDFWQSVIIVNPKVFYGGNSPKGIDSANKWFQALN